MSMEAGERGELVKLWREVPGTMPSLSINLGVHTRSIHWSEENQRWHVHLPGALPMDFSDGFVAALARDAIVEWLLARVTFSIHEAEGGCKLRMFDRLSGMPVDPDWVSGPTRLLALIAAARAVGGGEKAWTNSHTHT
jgi:hypothetical protein